MTRLEGSTVAPRRTFLSRLTAGAVALVAGGLTTRSAEANPVAGEPVAADEAWLGNIRGKHRQVVDAVTPNSGFAFAYARNFVAPHIERGVKPRDVTAVIVLRHHAIPFGFTNPLWAKYKFGEQGKINMLMSPDIAQTNFVYKPSTPLPLPGMAIDDLLSQGAVIVMCNVALSIASGDIAKATNQSPEAVKKELIAGMIPGITIVPSGVYAVNRAQEKGCTYCYGG